MPSQYLPFWSFQDKIGLYNLSGHEAILSLQFDQLLLTQLTFTRCISIPCQNIHNLGTGTNSAFWPLSRIHWLYALMHNKYILVLFRFTTNKKISDLINMQYKSTTKSIQIEICDPVIYHVRFLSLNCLIEDMIIPIHSLICPLYCPAVMVRTKD